MGTVVLVLYIASIVAIVVLTILLSIILYRIIRILGVLMEIIIVYERIKTLFSPSLVLLDHILSVVGLFQKQKPSKEK